LFLFVWWVLALATQTITPTASSLSAFIWLSPVA
jgi:hypothetical protein